MEKIITIFGSSILKPSSLHYRKAVIIGELLAKNNYTVCSGGYGGIMEAVSKGAKNLNGNTIGITLDNPERKPNDYITENVIMPNWVERMMELIAIGDAYIIFKGGSGTLVEISTVIEMMNKKIMKNKLMVYYSNFWKDVLKIINKESSSLKEIIRKGSVFLRSENELLKILNKFRI